MAFLFEEKECKLSEALLYTFGIVVYKIHWSIKMTI